MRRRMGRPGLMGTMARTAVIAGTATAVSGGMRNRQQAGPSSKPQSSKRQQTPMPSWRTCKRRCPPCRHNKPHLQHLPVT